MVIGQKGFLHDLARWYLEYLFETRLMTAMLRVDKGTETGRHHGDINPHETVVYGPSTSNQACIETQLNNKVDAFFMS